MTHEENAQDKFASIIAGTIALKDQAEKAGDAYMVSFFNLQLTNAELLHSEVDVETALAYFAAGMGSESEKTLTPVESVFRQYAYLQQLRAVRKLMKRA